ncbi:MAG TPA: type VI secretion system tip protein TssI/VgrG [Polyangiaceae bacterium]|nr:type VI secretion system tip protein TssI/VgrG [Polyangiaceae bacterium]
MSAKVEFKLAGDGLPDDVRPNSFEAIEKLSTPYRVEVELATLDDAWTPETIMRKSLTLEIVDTDRARVRTLSGIVSSAEFLHHDGTHFIFRACIEPPIAALRSREDCRIYQDQSVDEIAKKVLAAAGVDKVEWRLSASYPKREYTVQYRESELDFIHRLFEDEGIFYFFEHSGGEATMVIADSTATISDDTSVPIVFAMSQGMAGTDTLSDFSFKKRLRPGMVRLRDYDFEKPQTQPDATQSADESYPSVVYEFPGGFTKAADGQRRATARLRELRRDAEVARGRSTASALEVGRAFNVVGASQEPLNGRFIVTELRARGRQSLSGAAGAKRGVEPGAHEAEASNSVANEFFAIPDGAPYSPPRTTKRPRIDGLQTATVTGPSMADEEIHCDKYGRIKVRFHWDRVGQHDDQSSCWVRVMQVPLGGGLIIPRVGWELAIAFLEGDPDKPVAVGRVYNSERTPPYALPAAKTSGSLKSASTPGGAGFNEIKMGDSGGSQGFGVSAQKDYNVSVGHDQNETVAVDESTSIKVNSKLHIGSNQTVSIGGNQEVNVGTMGSQKVTGDISISVGGNAVDNATSNYVEKVGGARTNTIGGNMLVICNSIAHTVATDITRSVSAVQLCASIASLSTTVAGNVTENVSLAKVDLCKGSFAETITGSKTSQILAADIHLVKGSYSTTSGASTTTLVGGLRYVKAGGDYSVKAPMITLIGATGTLKGGSSELKLGGGPIVVTGSKIAIETALLVKLGTSLKMGS